MAHPSVDADPPPGWTATEITRPTLGGGSGATFTQWTATQSPESGEVLLLGCVSTPIPGWVEPMRPAVEGRTLSFAASAAERIVGVQVEAVREGAHFALRPVGSTGEQVGVSRTFVGWSRDEVVTCFATCASRRAGPRACAASVDHARLEGSLDPPPPGLALGAITWAVRHPSRTLVCCGLLVFVVVAIALRFRRRPRSRI